MFADIFLVIMLEISESFRKFLAEIIRHTINLCTFSLCEHSGNRLNVIIEHYKFNTFIAMFLIIKRIF